RMGKFQNGTLLPGRGAGRNPRAEIAMIRRAVTCVDDGERTTPRRASEGDARSAGAPGRTTPPTRRRTTHREPADRQERDRTRSVPTADRRKPTCPPPQVLRALTSMIDPTCPAAANS